MDFIDPLKFPIANLIFYPGGGSGVAPEGTDICKGKGIGPTPSGG
jgi:hypothetical protein